MKPSAICGILVAPVVSARTARVTPCTAALVTVAWSALKPNVTGVPATITDAFCSAPFTVL